MKTLAEPFDMTPPSIQPVPEGVHRPLWSVMIPTYNCAKYLRQTLESVLSQGPALDQMQIEVVDDCSTQDDPESVVREIGKGRVAFYRKPQNAGAIANFNTCIERSRGHLVHILHGDDWVAPGYYEAFTLAAKQHPKAALLASRVFFVEEDGVICGVSQRYQTHETLPSREVNSFWFGNPLQFAGVTIRREFYEQFGGFRPELIHTADWEMWVRAVHQSSGLILPQVLGFYRMFATNDTGRLMRTGENLRDLQRLAQILEMTFPNFPKKLFSKFVIDKSWSQAIRFKELNDTEAYHANLEYWKKNVSNIKRFRAQFSALKQWLKIH